MFTYSMIMQVLFFGGPDSPWFSIGDWRAQASNVGIATLAKGYRYVCRASLLAGEASMDHRIRSAKIHRCTCESMSRL